MNMKGLLVALALLVVLSISGSQPIPKTTWTVINENAAVDSSSYPRISTFSNGDYIIVYGISQDIMNNRIAFKIFSSSGLVKVPETVVSGLVGNYFAPNVLVVGDIAVIVWRDVFGNLAYQSQVTNDGAKIIGSSLPLPSSSFNKEDTFGLFIVNNVTFGLTLSPSNESAGLIVYYRIGSTAPFFQTGDSLALEMPAAIYDPRLNTTVTFVQRANNYYAVSSYDGDLPGGFGPSTSLTVNQFKYTVPFLTDDPAVLGFITNAAQPSAIRLGIWDALRGQLSVAYGLMFDPLTTRNMRPDAIHLGSNYALIAHSTRNYSLSYRYVRINEGSYDLIGPVMNEEPMSSNGVSMVKVGNNIVVTAFDAKPSRVMTRVLTFCGNGVIDSNLNEQCDSSSGCSTDCTCVKGTLAKNGLCLDVCGNGIVTGNEDCDGTVGCDPVTCKCQAGYQPYVLQQQCRPIPASFVPKVGPALDCLTINNDNSLNLFFSFVSSDSFDQIIQYGAMNDFIPNNLATDRPTFFKSGTSLTYPVSPYNLTVSSTLSLFTWLLGSYNLTVDFSGDKASALQCPKNAGFVMTVATFDTLSDSDVQQLVVNIAHKYNMSTDRLDATYRLSTAGSVSQPNIYSISITILASMNPSDPSAQDILKELYSDLKDSKDQLSSELTQGLSEKNPQIKDVTPNPTGVEVRSQQRDVAPTSVNVGPMPTSGALPSKRRVFWFTVLAFLLLW